VSYTPEANAADDAEVRARHEANRQAWNEGASTYTATNQERVDQLRAGKSNLHPIERANLAPYGPLSQWCQRAIHLQCASGNDTLSLLLEGAHEVVGIDISDEHIRNARWTTEQLEVPASWHRCDLLDTPASLDGTADLVYTGRGAICWLHDLDAWAQIVTRLLKPGGLLSLLDDHPASWLFEQETQTLQASGVNYFSHSEQSKCWSEAYIGDLGKPVQEHATKHEQLWTVAQVFQALVRAGLSVEYLGEHPDEYWTAFPNLSDADKAKIPMTFSLIARKPPQQ